MITQKKERRIYMSIYGLCIGFLIFCIVGVVCATAEQKSEPEQTQPETTTIRIVYEDDFDEKTEFVDVAGPVESTTYRRFYYPLTADEREKLARIVAGKAGNKREICQQLVANVIYNDVTDCEGDLEYAVKKYGLGSYGTPTADTYEAVDNVFFCAEFLLDEDVLYFNDVDHYSTFHESLVFVCEFEGIRFYKEHIPAIVSDGIGIAF